MSPERYPVLSPLPDPDVAVPVHPALPRANLINHATGFYTVKFGGQIVYHGRFASVAEDAYRAINRVMDSIPPTLLKDVPK